MIIKYQSVDLEKKEIDLEHAINIQINGLQISISEDKEGLRIQTVDGSRLLARGMASNCMVILPETFRDIS
jgi:hypothetical protein